MSNLPCRTSAERQDHVSVLVALEVVAEDLLDGPDEVDLLAVVDHDSFDARLEMHPLLGPATGP
jgi:hypothetical protein